MSFEDFDQQIADAAEKHHPMYHEEAWGRMNRLLNEHLPESRKKKRRLLLWLPLLLLLTAGGYFMLQPGNGQPGLAEKKQTGTSSSGTISNEAPKENKGTIPTVQQPVQPAVIPGKNPELPTANENNNSNVNIKDKAPVVFRTRSGTSKKSFSEKKANYTNNDEAITGSYPTQNSRKQNRSNSIVKNNKQQNSLPPVILKEEEGNEPLVTEAIPEPPTVKEPDNINEVSKTIPAADNNLPKTNTAPVVVQKTPIKVKRNGNGFGNAFAITLSAGADMAVVHFTEPGQKRFVAGAGLQYQVNKNMAVRAGFYQARKVYAAQPQDYHPDYSYNPPGHTLLSVDGNCRVFEIPVSVAYTVNPGKKLNIFAAAGVSSMIMKTEDYHYNYKTNYGQYRGYDYNLENKNEHLFSSIDFSLGTEKKLGERLFFRVEPYLRLPLRGVGYGNVRLKSAGVLFTAGFKPFAKK